jgi:hypothetical protein
MDQYDPREVLDRYIAVLGAAGGSIIRDAGDLGHPKDIVKFVLQHCIRTIEAADQQKFLRDAYLSLAGFQVLSEQERAAAAHLNQIWPEAPAGAQLDGATDRFGEAAAPLQEVLARMRAETVILTQELKSLPGVAEQV